MRVYSRKTILMGLMAGSMLCAFAQQAQPPKVTTAPLAFKVEWVRPVSQEDTKVRYMPVQQNIADPNVIMTLYGKAAKDLRHLSPHDISPNVDIGPGDPSAIK